MITTYIILGMIGFIGVNLIITLCLRNENDGWLEHYRKKALDNVVNFAYNEPVE